MGDLESGCDSNHCQHHHHSSSSSAVDHYLANPGSSSSNNGNPSSSSPSSILPFSPYAQQQPQPSYPPEAYQDIHKACVHGLIDVIENMLKSGINPNLKDKDGYVPLHWAAVNNRLEICQLLVSKNADVDAKGAENVTALHWAALYGHFAVCHFLASNSNQKSPRDEYGFTPYLRAVQGNYIAVAVLLRWHGSDVEGADHQGHNALHWAAHFGFPQMTDTLLMMDNTIIDQPDMDGNTALHIACKQGNGPIANKLVKAGASLESKNKEGKTPEQVATENRRGSISRWLKLMRIIPCCKSLAQQNQRNPIISIMAVSCIFAAYLYYGFVLASKTPGLLWAHMFMLCFGPPMMFCYYKAYTSDPGTVRSNTEEVINALATGVITSDEVCLTCIVKKPPRSKHCQLCGICVEIMDHHCGWINNCVGRKNRLYFMGFTTLVLVCLLSFCYIDTTFMLEHTTPINSEIWTQRILMRIGSMIYLYPGAFTMLIIYILYSIFVFAINVQLFSGVALNITTNERYNWRRYSHFRRGDGSFVNRFDHGFVTNCKDFFKESLSSPHIQQRPLLSMPPV